jgi:hypothetical protein
MSNCKTKNCGCLDTGLTTPSPCSCNVAICCNPPACPETFNDCCIIHMGDPIVNLHINTGDALCTILQKLAIYITVNPTCIDPTNLCGSALNFQTTSITSSVVNLYWDPILSATSYRVEYSIAGSGVWIPTLPITINTAAITGLTSNTEYYVRVLTGCLGIYDCTSVTLSFKTKTLTP